MNNARFKCDVKSKAIIKRYLQTHLAKTLKECTSPSYMVTNIIAEQINCAALYGYNTEAWKSIYFQGHIPIVTSTPEFLPH